MPDTLQAGESVTRTITLRGTGLQGAQLPPITFEAQDGLRYYPDQPAVTDAESAAGLVGQRRESAALVANRAGRFTLPEIRIPWWDVAQDTVRYAVLPARDITVAPAASAMASPPATQTKSPGANDVPFPLDPAPKGHSRLWQWLTAFFAVLWVATIVLFWRWRPAVQATPPNAPLRNNSEARAFKQLQAACASDSAAPARDALLHWAQAYLDMPRPIRADELARHLGDDLLGLEQAFDEGLVVQTLMGTGAVDNFANVFTRALTEEKVPQPVGKRLADVGIAGGKGRKCRIVIECRLCRCCPERKIERFHVPAKSLDVLLQGGKGRGHGFERNDTGIRAKVIQPQTIETNVCSDIQKGTVHRQFQAMKAQVVRHDLVPAEPHLIGIDAIDRTPVGKQCRLCHQTLPFRMPRICKAKDNDFRLRFQGPVNAAWR